jgi:hypothetical protein
MIEPSLFETWRGGDAQERRSVLAFLVLEEYATTHRVGRTRAEQDRWQRLRGKALEHVYTSSASAGAGVRLLKRYGFGLEHRSDLLLQVADMIEILDLVREIPAEVIDSLNDPYPGSQEPASRAMDALWNKMRTWRSADV